MGDIGATKSPTSKPTGSSAVKLIASKNIAKPQVMFAVPPNNSCAPFSPILKTKPNAIVHLEGMLFDRLRFEVELKR